MSMNESLDHAKRATGSFFKKLLISLFLLALIAAGITYLLTKVTYSEGDRAGVVSKFSRKGVIFKTYEGELNVGAQGQVGNLADNTWKFTVSNSDDLKITKSLEEAMLSGKRIRLHYQQRYVKFPWMGETEYFVTMADQATP